MWPELRKFASDLPLVGPALRSAYRRAHGLPDVEGSQSDAPDFRYHAWIERRVRERSGDYPAPTENAPRFDILTLVFNTDADVLRKTAASVFAQDFANFRWVLWDNGSDKAQTREALEEIAKDARVVFHRSEQNLGITNGHLKALDLCTAEYIAFLDHDDLLYPDALRINAWHIAHFSRPDFLYSDEDKCDMQDRRFNPYFKPDFSPALLLDTGYTCHLSVVKLAILRACGAFTDPLVEGTQDWDTALRVQDYIEREALPAVPSPLEGEGRLERSERGVRGRIVHIPEILYTWRGVPESTAVRGVEAKPHVIAAQKRCVESALERRGLRDDFEPRPNDLFGEPDGHWRFQRRKNFETSIDVILISSSKEKREHEFSIEKMAKLTVNIHKTAVHDRVNLLNRLLEQTRGAEYIALFYGDLLLQNWLLEALSILKLHANALLVVGRTSDVDFTTAGPEVLGSEKAARQNAQSPGYFGQNFVHRNVSAFVAAPWVARRSEFAALRVSGEFPTLWEADLCLRAIKSDKGIVYSPFIGTPGVPSAGPAEEEQLAFIRAHHELIRDDPYYSPFCSLKAESLYSIVEPAERAAVLNPLFEKAGVPLVPTDRYELGRYARLRRGPA